MPALYSVHVGPRGFAPGFVKEAVTAAGRLSHSPAGAVGKDDRRDLLAVDEAGEDAGDGTAVLGVWL